MKIILKILVLIIFSIPNAYGQEYQIPFELVHNNIIINAKINNVNCKLLYDTGANSVKIDSQFASKNNITTKSVYKNEVGFIFENYERKIKYLILLDLKIYGGEIYDGIIGVDFFKDYITKIDYESQTITLLNSFEENNEYIKLETIHHKKNPYFLNLFTVNLQFNVSNKTFQGNFLIDTGSGRGLTLTNFLSKKIIENVNSKKVQLKSLNSSNFGFNNPLLLKVERVDINDLKFEDIIVDCNLDVDKSTSAFIDGIIGGKILKNFTILINFNESLIYLKKNKIINFNQDYYSDGFQIKDYRKSGKGIIVTSIYKPNIYDVDINLGDKIIEVDNESFDTINFQKIGK